MPCAMGRPAAFRRLVGGAVVPHCVHEQPEAQRLSDLPKVAEQWKQTRGSDRVSDLWDPHMNLTTLTGWRNP